MGLLVFYLFLALGVSFLCSILEAVLLSITPSFMAVLEQDGLKAGRLLRELKDDIDRPLSAILSLNTIAHTVGAAGVGAQAQIVFGNASVTIASIILTLLILVISEIIPKTLGALYWKELSGFAARTVKILMFVTWPLVLLSMGITRWLAREERQPGVTREELGAMAEIGVREGVFEQGESTIFTNLIRFSSLRARDIMTPRIVVVKFQEDITISEALEHKEQLYVSRMPVHGEDEEDITGYILKNDLYYYLSGGDGDKQLKEIKREMPMCPENISLKSLFERLLREQEHIVGVVDEYGGFSGLVTMEDVVETLLGMEIVDEMDAVEDMQKMARQTWRERARRMGIELPEERDTEEQGTEEQGTKEQDKDD